MHYVEDEVKFRSQKLGFLGRGKIMNRFLVKLCRIKQDAEYFAPNQRIRIQARIYVSRNLVIDIAFGRFHWTKIHKFYRIEIFRKIYINVRPVDGREILIAEIFLAVRLKDARGTACRTSEHSCYLSGTCGH